MSLVHEALEKAAREKRRKTAVVSVSEPLQRSAAGSAAAMGAGGVAGSSSGAVAGGGRSSVVAKYAVAVLVAAVASVAAVGIVALVLLWRIAASRTAVAVSAEKLPAAAEAAAAITPAAAASAVEPLQPVTEQAPGFRLTGIMKDPDGRFAAVLNGRVVYEGHYVDGAIVQKIERDRLTIEMNGRRAVLRLF